MAALETKRRWFENVVRLVQAERKHPDDEDIAAVRLDLERELGLVLSRSLSAKLLGVHHSSLQRWIDASDVPLVMDENGRSGVPLSVLVELYEATQLGRESGSGRSHVLEPALSHHRLRAMRLQPQKLVADVLESREEPDPHERSARRSLAYHRAVARRLTRPMVDQARRQVWTWRRQGRIRPHYADAWDEILARPVREIKTALSDGSQVAADLRQSSPFAGALSEPERQKILAEVR